MRDDLILIATALVSFATASGTLRGNYEVVSSEQSSRRLARKGLQNLKQINAERKRKNKQKYNADKEEYSITIRDDEEWSTLSKEEKKQLIKELREEENSAKKDQSGGARAKVKPNQLAYLQQYFHHLDNGMEMNTEALDGDSDVKWTDFTKEEKKRVQELINGGFNIDTEQNESGIIQNTNEVGDHSDVSSNEADEFVIHNRPRPGTLTVDAILDHYSQNNDDKNGENDFAIPMPSLTFDTSLNSGGANNGSTGIPRCPTCYTFASQLPDPSIQLDDFGPSSDLQWSMIGLGWKTTSEDCYEGKLCMTSGITSALDHQGEPVKSELVLKLTDEFKGGVLTFQLAVRDGLRMPNEAFFVTVDGEVMLSQLSVEEGWTEYSVSVGRGEHTVTWSHVLNPLGLKSLPTRSVGGLIIDDLRYSPFEGIKQQNFEDNKSRSLAITLDGDAEWQVDDKESNSGSYSIVASTKDIKQDSGSSNANFVLYSEEGGTLKYKILSSTTAPHEDFAIFLNGKLVDVVFGSMLSFDKQSLEIPAGKVNVSLRHRKNPGKLSGNLLDALGTVRTNGFTRLDDIRFEPK